MEEETRIPTIPKLIPFMTTDGWNDDVVRPNTHYFNAAMMAHAHSHGGVESAKRVESLLDWIQELYHNGND